MTGALLPAQLQKTLIAQGLSPDYIAAIFETAGVIAARTHDIERFLGKTVTPGLAMRLKEVKEDAFEVRTLQCIPVMSVFFRTDTAGWGGAAIGIPRRIDSRYSAGHVAFGGDSCSAAHR